MNTSPKTLRDQTLCGKNLVQIDKEMNNGCELLIKIKAIKSFGDVGSNPPFPVRGDQGEHDYNNNNVVAFEEQLQNTPPLQES